MSPVNVVSVPSSRVVTTPVTLCPEASVSRRCTWAPVTSVTLSWDEHRIHADDLRVRLCVQQAGEAVDPVAADARTCPCRPSRLGLLEVDADREVEGVQPELLQVVVQLLDAGFVGHRRVGVLRAGMAFARVLAVLAVHQVEMFGLGVVGLQSS